MYYLKLLNKVKESKLLLHEESLYVSFQLQDKRVSIEYLKNDGFVSVYSKDTELIELLKSIYDYAVSLGFVYSRNNCTISLEDSNLLALPNATEFYDSLDDDEVDLLFNEELDFETKKFVIETFVK